MKNLELFNRNNTIIDLIHKKESTMRKLIFSATLLIGTVAIAQTNGKTGINTTDPKATLEVKGNPESTTAVDGVIAPKIKRNQLISKTAYATDQTGAIVYVTDLSGDISQNPQTMNVTKVGYFYFDGAVWRAFVPDVPSTSENIYNADGTLTDHRTLRMEGKNLSFIARGTESISIGGYAANGVNTLTMMGGHSTGENNIVIGKNVEVAGDDITAIKYGGGNNNASNAANSLVIGGYISTDATASISIGQSYVYSPYSLALNGGVRSGGSGNVAIGSHNGSITNGNLSTRAGGINSLAMMAGTTVNGVSNQVAIGKGTLTSEAIPFAVGTNGNQLTIASNGNVGIGMGATPATQKLEVEGNVKINGVTQLQATAISAGATCTNGQIGFGTDGNFYGCKGGVWLQFTLVN